MRGAGLSLVLEVYHCHRLFLSDASPFVLGTFSDSPEAVNAALENV